MLLILHNKLFQFVLIGPWAKNDDGSYFKAALLSGSPGVGNYRMFYIIILLIIWFYLYLSIFRKNYYCTFSMQRTGF